MESTALFALERMTGDEIADVDHITEFANVACSLNPLEEIFRLLEEQVQAFLCTTETEVTANDADVG